MAPSPCPVLLYSSCPWSEQRIFNFFKRKKPKKNEKKIQSWNRNRSRPKTDICAKNRTRSRPKSKSQARRALVGNYVLGIWQPWWNVTSRWIYRSTLANYKVRIVFYFPPWRTKNDFHPLLPPIRLLLGVVALGSAKESYWSKTNGTQREQHGECWGEKKDRLLWFCWT
jgi:hypothetical protein